MTLTPNEDLQNYWDDRYRNDQTGWDIGYASSPLSEFAQHIKKKDAAILIPGCGNGYEAEKLVELGFTKVTVLDISDFAISNLKKRLGEKVKYVHGDFFEHEGRYDYILEQTFFCALHPSLREKYVDQMHKLLAPGGILAGVLFNRDFEGGPPFGGNIEEYRNLFAEGWEILKLEECYNSIPPRAGTEAFIIFRKA